MPTSAKTAGSSRAVDHQAVSHDHVERGHVPPTSPAGPPAPRRNDATAGQGAEKDPRRVRRRRRRRSRRHGCRGRCARPTRSGSPRCSHRSRAATSSAGAPRCRSRRRPASTPRQSPWIRVSSTITGDCQTGPGSLNSQRTAPVARSRPTTRPALVVVTTMSLVHGGRRPDARGVVVADLLVVERPHQRVVGPPRIDLHELADLARPLVLALELGRDVQEALVVSDDRGVGVVAGPEPEDPRRRRRPQPASRCPSPARSPPELAKYTVSPTIATEFSMETSLSPMSFSSSSSQPGALNTSCGVDGHLAVGVRSHG